MCQMAVPTGCRWPWQRRLSSGRSQAIVLREVSHALLGTHPCRAGKKDNKQDRRWLSTYGPGLHAIGDVAITPCSRY